MAPAKLVQRPVIGLQTSRQETESQVLVEALFDAPRTRHAQRIGVQPNFQQQLRRVAGPASSPTAAAVSSPHGVRVIRSVAATAGWRATWHPRGGAAAPLAVHRDGLVQAVDVPAGRGVVTWHYRPPGFRTGSQARLRSEARCRQGTAGREAFEGEKS